MKILFGLLTLLTTLTSAFDPPGCNPDRWFRCNDNTCVSKTWRCDGEADCADGSDESGCQLNHEANPRFGLFNERDDHGNLGFKPCNTSIEFRCHSHDLCVPLFWVCDGRADCTDKSDENVTMCLEFKSKHHCGNSEDMFFCHDKGGSCIAKRWTCNGEVDCPNGFDEAPEVCNRTTIIPDISVNCDQGFQCRNSSTCLTWGQVCNNHAECPHRDDEDPEQCSQACNHLQCNDQQMCQPTPDGQGVCLCKNGFQAVNGSLCQDIDECQLNPPPCSQRCINGNGDFFCDCEDGYILDSNGDCRVESGKAQLLFSSDHEIRIKNIPDNDRYDLVANHSSNFLRQAIGVSFDPVEQRVYWADIFLKKIVSSTLDGSRFQIWNHTQIEKPEFIAIDYIGRNIYYSDSKKKFIGVCTIQNGHFCQGLITTGVTNPRGIAVYPEKGLLAYSNWDDDFDNHPHIGLSGMDGQDLKILANTSIKWPNGVAFDIPSQRVFWGDAFYDLLESVKLDGSRRVSVKPALNFMSLHPFSVSVFEDTIYWTDSAIKEVQSCHKFSGDHHRVEVKSAKIKPNAVHVIHQALFPSRSSPCLDLRCSQLCLIKKGGLEGTCSCGHFYNLVDNHRCELDIKYERPLLPFLPVRFDNLEIAETVNSNTVTTIGELGTTMTTEVPLSEISTNVQDQLSNMELNQTEQFHVVHAAPIMKKTAHDNTIEVIIGVIVAILCFVAALVFFYCCWVKRQRQHAACNSTRTGSQVFFKNPSFGLDQNNLKGGQCTKVDEELRTIEVIGPVRSQKGTTKEVFNYSIGSGDSYEELDFNPSKVASDSDVTVSKSELMIDELPIDEDNDRYQLLD